MADLSEGFQGGGVLRGGHLGDDVVDGSRGASHASGGDHHWGWGVGQQPGKEE